MPLIIAALWGALVSLVGTIVGRVLVSLAIGYATFSGIDASLTWAKNQFLSGLSGLPADAIGLAHTMKLGVCVSMLLAALTTRLLIAGMTSGSLKRMVFK